MWTWRHVLAGTLAACSVGAHAASFPTHETRFIVPFPAGGPTDVIARILAQGLDRTWQQPVVVENKPGAGTMIGAATVAKAPADGHTFGIVISAYTINPAIRSKMPYDTLRELTGITQVARANMALVAPADAPFDDVPGLVRYAQAHQGQLTYATPGPGTATHLAGEMFKRAAGAEIVHVPYNGSGPALTDLIGGRVDLMFDIVHSVRPHVQAGKLKLLAVTAGARDPEMPDTPTIAETLPGFEIYSTIGLVAPAATPEATIATLQRDVAGVLAQPEVRSKLAELGVTPVGSSPAEWNDFIRQDIQRWTEVARASGIRLD
ncbi:tripartite tricarboxylate transporter substrate binding protein [Verticiella sediminum]|uniref:Tripartite tricarboxylate transporter substrate binding protein n=1 Tax=Verticiella sediminum TaxID=1247510 RepID=A0A556AFE4_9BURK|nr:tripartite tricarboxylate transporter substrate binding protein [Verticiella sediminum]TSH91597.1 tripartite tricarboxylate transporter substrate binding protein [Verticiella sediminum]